MIFPYENGGEPPVEMRPHQKDMEATRLLNKRYLP
jgi:hypothetical protein